MCYNKSGILISTYTYMLIVACGLQYSACDMRFRESRKRKHQLGMRAETPGGEPSKPSGGTVSVSCKPPSASSSTA